MLREGVHKGIYVPHCGALCWDTALPLSAFQKLGWSLGASSEWCCRGRCYGLDKSGVVPQGVAVGHEGKPGSTTQGLCGSQVGGRPWVRDLGTLAGQMRWIDAIIDAKQRK